MKVCVFAASVKPSALLLYINVREDKLTVTSFLCFPSGSVSRAFETQMTRLEAEFVRREAPPSYGQLIAQGLIPPVEDFPVYNASQVWRHKCQ